MEELDNSEKELKKKKKKKLKEAEVAPTRGIETMFRTSSKTHLELSAMADNKANIIISINAIILSLIISILIRRFEEAPHLIIPTALLVFTSLTAVFLATISTRPKVNYYSVTKEDIKKKTGNLLFFGNFLNMSLEDFQWGMNEMMKDRDYLYGSMTKDLYFAGLALGRKYKYLHLAYNFFMYGLLVSTIAFVVSGLFFVK